MIYSIKGSLEAQLDDAIVVQTNGIGYLIHCTTKTMQEYHISDDISLIIYYHVREDAHVLYGFNSTEERTFFEQLISVSGIGPKVAMGILSSMPMPDLVAAIANENAMLITQCPGIGKKTASRLIIELKDGVEMENSLVKLKKKNTNIWKQLEFISFNYKTICMAKKIFPSNKCLWLLNLDYNSKTKQNNPSNKDIVDKIKQHNLDGIDVFAGEAANEVFFKAMHQEKFEIYLWNINTIEHAKQYLPFSPHGLTTDKPKWMKEQLNRIYDK